MIAKCDELMSDPEFRKEMAIESSMAEAAEVIAQLMAAQNLSKADVARRLNKSRSWVTQMLNGKANMTIRTLAEVTFALGAQLSIQSTPEYKAATPRLENGKAHRGQDERLCP
jgi:transcriptional regulator with XRE-family HTH domain